MKPLEKNFKLFVTLALKEKITVFIIALFSTAQNKMREVKLLHLFY